MPTRFSPLHPLTGRARLAPARWEIAGRLVLASTAGLTGLTLLSGCAVSRVTPAAGTSAAVHLTGHAFGGQQPISGAQIQLYAAGTGGNGSAATAMLTTAVYSDANGAFDITGDYTCPSSGAQVYLTATGGNPGLPGNATNSSIALVTALGDCGLLATTQTVQISELSTAAAAWALAPFATSLTHIGTTSTNLAGLRGAMSLAKLLVDSYNGIAPSPSLPAGATTETAKLITMADLLADCVNTDGTGFCPTFFSHATPAAGTAPADTFTAALAIAQNPAHNVSTLFNDLLPQQAFAGALSSAPNEWTMSIAYSGGGLRSPSGITIDAANNLWVSNLYGSVSSFTQGGVAQFATGVTGNGLNLSTAIAIDPSANVWVTNQATSGISGPGSVTLMSPSGSIMSGTNGITTGNVNAPNAVAADQNGSVWVANSASNSVTLFDHNGAVLSGQQGYGIGYVNQPNALAVDPVHNVWVANTGSGVLVKLDPSGNILKYIACCSSPSSLALDSQANVWLGDRNANQLSLVASNGAILIPSITGSGINGPVAVTTDTADNVYVVNEDGNSISIFAGSNNAQPAGTALTPVNGFGNDAHLRLPLNAAVDASGNLWVTSSADNRVVGFVGLAAPVKTPRYTVPQLP